MDPTKALTNALASLGALAETEGLRIANEHREDAIEHLEALVGWLRSGGFAPSNAPAIVKAMPEV